MTIILGVALWLGLGFFCGFVVGSILRERDRPGPDGEYVELLPRGKDFL